jgi:DNA repair exonuclease SbcCD ATPase subunit
MPEKLEEDSKRVSRRQTKPKTVTGRTQWDALVDIFNMLGTVAPYIAFVGLGLFGFYKFTQLTEQNASDFQKAQAEASKNYESQIATANKVLAQTYDEIGKMSSSQITNLNAMLDLHSKAAKQTQDLQVNVQELRQKEEQQKKDAIADADKAAVQMSTLSFELQRMKSDKEKVEADLSEKLDQAQKLDTEIKALASSLASKREALSTSADEISNIRQSAAELAQAVAESRPNAAELANTIIKELGASNSQLLANLLHQDTQDKALKSLIGISEAELTSFLKQKGFVFVIRVPNFFGGGYRYLAPLNKTHDGVFEPVLDVEVDKGRTTSAIVSKALAAYKAPDPQDWYTYYR